MSDNFPSMKFILMEFLEDQWQPNTLGYEFEYMTNVGRLGAIAKSFS